MKIPPISLILLICLVISCNRDLKQEQRKFYDSKGKHIGDSILTDGYLSKVIFYDSTYTIDSIIYTRYKNHNIKSKNCYIEGKNASENVTYYENGNIQTYLFLDPDKKECYLRSEYDELGNFISNDGVLFFLGYVDGIDSNLCVKVGTTISINVFYPNPPGYNTSVYAAFEDRQKYFFHQSDYISNLKSVKVDNNKIREVEWGSIDIHLDLEDKIDSSIQKCNMELFYKKIP